MVAQRRFGFIKATVCAVAVCSAIAVCGSRHSVIAATSGATIIDHAHLFTAADNRNLNRTAAVIGLHLIVATDSQARGDGNPWVQHTISTYGAPDVVLLAIHVDLAEPSQSLVTVWSGNGLGLTSADDQTAAHTLIVANPSMPLADRIDAMLGRLQIANNAGLRAQGTAATAVQIGRGIRSITVLMVILAWIFVLIRRRLSASPLSLPTRLVGVVIFALIALLWLGIAWNAVDLATNGNSPVTGVEAPGAVAGALLVDLTVVLGAISVVKRLMRRRPKAALVRHSRSDRTQRFLIV